MSLLLVVAIQLDQVEALQAEEQLQLELGLDEPLPIEVLSGVIVLDTTFIVDQAIDRAEDEPLPDGENFINFFLEDTHPTTFQLSEDDFEEQQPERHLYEPSRIEEDFPLGSILEAYDTLEPPNDSDGLGHFETTVVDIPLGRLLSESIVRYGWTSKTRFLFYVERK